MRLMAACVLSGALFWAPGGCPPENYPTLLPTNLEEIDEIRNDTTLTCPEQRAALEDLGLSAVTINAMLRSDRTCNQYGGDLRSAYDKAKLPDYRLFTPDEIQVYGDGATTVDSEISLNLADDEARELVLFFNNNDIPDASTLEAYLDAGGSVPEEIALDVLTDLFIDFDPDDLISILP